MNKPTDLQALPGAVILVAPVNGDIIPLQDFPDPVFSQGMLGTGIGFMPQGEVVVAPSAAQVVSVFPGGHALVMKTDEGLELLVHIGLDTVDLNGQGFAPMLIEGERVEQGQALIKFDLETIKKAGKELHTALIVTNKEIIEDFSLAQGGQAIAGETPVMAVKPKK